MRFILPGESDQADLGIVIVSWNVKDLLIKNLEAIWQSIGERSLRVIVVDNASKDGTIEALNAWKEKVIVIANQENLGFAKAVNQGIRAANARHILLLNPDMKVMNDALEKTVSYLETHPEVGVMGGHLLNEDGSTMPSVRRFPTIGSQLAVLLKIAKLFPGLLNRHYAKDIDYEKEQDVEQVRGSYFAISNRALNQLPGLDERYFIWFEEVDYCKQITELGMKVRYVPNIQAQDFVGRSFAQRKRFWKEKQFSKSMMQYFQKWHSWQGMIIKLIRPLPIAAAWMMDKLDKK